MKDRLITPGGGATTQAIHGVPGIAIDKYGVYHAAWTKYTSDKKSIYYSYSVDEGFTWTTPTIIYQVVGSGMEVVIGNINVIASPTHIHINCTIYKADNCGFVHAFRVDSGGEWTCTEAYAHSSQEHWSRNRLYLNESQLIRHPFWRHHAGLNMAAFNEGTLTWDAANQLNNTSTIYSKCKCSKLYPATGTMVHMVADNANYNPSWVIHNGTDWGSIYSYSGVDGAWNGCDLIAGPDSKFWIGFTNNDLTVIKILRVAVATRDTYTEETIYSSATPGNAGGISFMKDSQGNIVVVTRQQGINKVRRYNAAGLINSDVALPTTVSRFPCCVYQENYYKHDDVLRYQGYNAGGSDSNIYYTSYSLSEIFKKRNSFCSVPWDRLFPGPKSARKFPLY